MTVIKNVTFMSIIGGFFTFRAADTNKAIRSTLSPLQLLWLRSVALVFVVLVDD